jgi:UPF0716 family protein affecting phage T7 exclusion
MIYPGMISDVIGISLIALAVIMTFRKNGVHNVDLANDSKVK